LLAKAILTTDEVIRLVSILEGKQTSHDELINNLANQLGDIHLQITGVYQERDNALAAFSALDKALTSVLDKLPGCLFHWTFSGRELAQNSLHWG
jgi:hypothetical protein